MSYYFVYYFLLPFTSVFDAALFEFVLFIVALFNVSLC